MTIQSRVLITATLVAVIFFVSILSGCVTRRDIDGINTRLTRIEAQNEKTQGLAARMDSIIAAGAESDKRLQNDIRYSTDELGRQIAQLLENYNDLMSRIDQLYQKQPVVKLPPTSSPGAQSETRVDPGTSSTNPSTSTELQPSINCQDTYDSGFTKTRRGEYEEAIVDFTKFLEECGNHNDVENAYYWIGECYYSQGKYSQAVKEYEHLLSNYPDSPNTGRALYRLARCKQETGKTDEAKALFEQLIRDHAGTLEAEQATQLLKDL